MYDTNAARTTFLLAAQGLLRIEISCDDEPTVSRIIVLASYARRGVLSVKIVCGKARQCVTVPGDQGNVETRPKQPPSTLRQARGQSRCCLPRFLLTSLPAYLLFSRRFLHRVRFVSFSNTEELEEEERKKYTHRSYVLPLSFRSTGTILSVV